MPFRDINRLGRDMNIDGCFMSMRETFIPEELRPKGEVIFGGTLKRKYNFVRFFV